MSWRKVSGVRCPASGRAVDDARAALDGDIDGVGRGYGRADVYPLELDSVVHVESGRWY